MQHPAAAFQPMKAQFPEQEQLKCPRCDSTNTKFCYYNNYNLSQPRHFCKNCRRYWTKGGALRNIPVGGGSRKNTKRSSNPKRSSSSSSTSTTSLIHNPDSQPDPARTYVSPADHDRRILDIPGSFSSLLTSNGQFGGLLEGMNHSGSGMNSGPEMNADSGRSIGVDVQSNGNSESYWSGGNGWPDLAIYTPGSSFQ